MQEKSYHQSGAEAGPEVWQAIIQALQNIRYGSVEIIIQDAKIVQIERKEKVRFDKENSATRR
ncbi:MAG: hypothetical protein ALAOOOJD_03257 [bacterium]|nr:hypothetical protein [bacterium]